MRRKIIVKDYSKIQIKTYFESATQNLVCGILIKSIALLRHDKRVIIDKNDEGKCTIQLIYFARITRRILKHNFLFDSESPITNYSDIVYGNSSPKSSPRIDIKIKRANWDEESYIVAECKRLDGSSTLTKKYVTEGMSRFINGRYSKPNNFGIMIGFLVRGNKSVVVTQMNSFIITNYGKNNILKPDGKILFLSRHNRSVGVPKFKISHIIEDYP